MRQAPPTSTEVMMFRVLIFCNPGKLLQQSVLLHQVYPTFRERAREGENAASERERERKREKEGGREGGRRGKRARERESERESERARARAIERARDTYSRFHSATASSPS